MNQTLGLVLWQFFCVSCPEQAPARVQSRKVLDFLDPCCPASGERGMAPRVGGSRRAGGGAPPHILPLALSKAPAPCSPRCCSPGVALTALGKCCSSTGPGAIQRTICIFASLHPHLQGTSQHKAAHPHPWHQQAKRDVQYGRIRGIWPMERATAAMASVELSNRDLHWTHATHTLTARRARATSAPPTSIHPAPIHQSKARPFPCPAGMTGRPRPARSRVRCSPLPSGRSGELF